MTLATGLTLLRIALVPLLVTFLMNPETVSRFWSFGFFVIITLTDFLDGWIARRTNTVTDLGKLLDPLADKILVFTLLLYFMELHRIAFVWVALMLTREFAVLGLRSLAALKQEVIKADLGGKLKTVLQCIVLGWLILNLPHVEPLVWLMVLVTLISGVHYFWAHRSVWSSAS